MDGADAAATGAPGDTLTPDDLQAEWRLPGSESAAAN
jgi:hypothetical protein